MSDRNFRELLEGRWFQGNFVCLGLDSDYSKIPKSVRENRSVEDSIVKFNYAIMEATKDLVCAYKPNIAFYEQYGVEGINALQRTITDIHAIAPGVPVILDVKRGDIGNTNVGYVVAAFDFFKADAITVHPYLGKEALRPFLERGDKGIFVLCHTSNKDAGEFQDREMILSDKDRKEFFFENNKENKEVPDRLLLYEYVAHRVVKHWNENKNCGLVVGATYPADLHKVREIVGDMPILIPGIGAQEGDVRKTVVAGRDSRGYGIIVNSSRSAIFASRDTDFAEVARRETEKLHNLINRYRLSHR